MNEKRCRDKLQVLAMYLPQFHTIKENDEWWGRGYTEWKAVEMAYPLFEGHRQPHVPKNRNYYNLLQKEVMIWQSDLAKQYAVDGFVFYHYWFQHGIKLLEKPAENLLAWTDINIPFCFCWDPSAWKRTWANINGNTWAPKFEEDNNNEKKQNDGLLMGQSFGGEEYWLEHIKYLVAFFKDDRYIKMDGRPVFIFYNSVDIPCFEEMVGCWNGYLIEQGLKELYVLSFSDYNSVENGHIDRMRFGKHQMQEVKEVRAYLYDDVWTENLEKVKHGLKKTYWHGVVDYDDTPRRGRYGSVYLEATPEKFKKFFSLLVQKSIEDQNEYVFIDAWNEWGEGMYLEPDVANGTKYLECIKEVMNMEIKDLNDFNSNDVGLINGDPYNKINEVQIERDYYRIRYKMMQSWAQERLETGLLENYLLSKGIREIAIYGFGKHGKMLFEELAGSGIEVAYVIDTNKKQFRKPGIIVYDLNDELPKVDAIIISIVENANSIKQRIQSVMDVSIYSLWEVIEDCINCAK